MLQPKRVKWRKEHRGRMRGNAKGGTRVEFGEYGLKSLERGWVTNRQIEAARIAMTRKIKRGGKVWINIFPDKPYTQKPAETRMGSGKGSPEGWVAVVKPGRVMFELSGVPEPLAREAMRLAGHKLPVKTKFVQREGGPVMKAVEVHNLEDAQLVEFADNARKELFNLRFQHATGQLENTARLKAAKSDLARALTVARAARHRRRDRDPQTESMPETEENVNEEQAPEARPPAEEAAPTEAAPRRLRPRRSPPPRRSRAEEPRRGARARSPLPRPEAEPRPEAAAERPPPAAARSPSPRTALAQGAAQARPLAPTPARRGRRARIEERAAGARRASARARPTHRRAYRAEAAREAPPREPRAEAPAGRGARDRQAKVRQGIVVSDRPTRRSPCASTSRSRHRKYKKIVRTQLDAARARRAQRGAHRRHRAPGREPAAAAAPSAGASSRCWRGRR